MQTKPAVFKGIATALVTPFTESVRGGCDGDGNGIGDKRADGIDYVSFGRIIEYQLSNGVDALVVCGTTGEAPVLSADEKREAIDFTVRQTRGRVPVIAGTGSNNIRAACELTEYASKAGASAVLAVTPYYNKTTGKGLVATYSAIAEASTVPVIIYNVPSRTGVNITPDEYLALSAIPKVAAVKEAGGDISAFAKSVALCGDRLCFYSGNDDMLLPTLSLGGCGVISVASNIVPKRMKKLYTLFLAGNHREAAAAQAALTPLEALLFREANPVLVKTALYHMGLCRKLFRLPLTEPEDANEKLLVSELARQGLLPKDNAAVAE